MKHIKAMSKTNPKAALSGLSKGSKTPCDSILKTPDEKEAKKNTES